MPAPAMPAPAPPSPTPEQHEFKAKSEEEKRAAHDEWVAHHTAAEEQRKREARFTYQLYYFVFHWREGLVASVLFVLKVLGILAGCWCLVNHKQGRKYNDLPGSPFRRGEVRRSSSEAARP